jgi:hypothetical protein
VRIPLAAEEAAGTLVATSDEWIHIERKGPAEHAAQCATARLGVKMRLESE